MDYLVSQLALYLAAMGLLGLLMGWWLGRADTKRGAKEAGATLELRLLTSQEENEQASLEVGRLADQLAQANVELEEAHERSSKVLSNLSAIEDQLVTERQRVASFEPLLAKRDDKLEQLRSELAAYHNRLTTIENDKRRAQDEIEQMASELSAAQNRATELQNVAASSEQRAGQLEARIGDSAELSAELERLRQLEEDFRLSKERSAARGEEQGQTRRRQEDAGQERDRVVAELATLGRRLEQAELERKSHDMAAEAARHELEAQRQRIRRSDERVAALESSSVTQSGLESEVESLRNELSASVRRVEELQQQTAAAEASRAAAESERDKAGGELEALLSAPMIDVDRMATAKPIVFEGTEADDLQAASSPELLDVPRGAADDLRRIRGIGEVLAETLKSLGIYHFGQIAGWSESDIQWVAAHLDTFPDRIVRDEWREQAAQLEREKQGRRA